ncbi:MAG: hypothetical protein HY318_12825, partial [Armatimonadetes bacterium]|nr:hypothetical protein [Armatimonadota bacterium]
RMDYSFVPGAFGRGSLFLGKEIPGRPVRLSVQVHSDGPACEVHFVLKDASGQTADRYGWTLWPKGWVTVPNMLDSPQVPWHAGADKPLQFPLTLEQLALVGTPWYGNRYKPDGTVYFDYLVLEFLAAESEVPPVPIEVQAKQDGARVLVTVKNVSKQPCKTRVSYWVSDAWNELTDRGVVAKTPFTLQAGEVVEFPLTFPRVTKAGDFEVEIAAVAVETGDLVELQAKWRK